MSFPGSIPAPCPRRARRDPAQGGTKRVLFSPKEAQARRFPELFGVYAENYRTFQAVFDVGARCLHWRRPIPVSGVGSVQKIPELLKKEKVQKVMVVTGPTVGRKLAPKILTELTGVKFSGSGAEKARAFIDEIRAMNRRMNIPTGAGGGQPRLPCAGHLYQNPVRELEA